MNCAFIYIDARQLLAIRISCSLWIRDIANPFTSCFYFYFYFPSYFRRTSALQFSSQCVGDTNFNLTYLNILLFVMASQTNQDWQLTKKTVLERNSYMFNNPLMSDVAFTCGESMKKLHAHKYVLATSSPVFHAMFYGDLAEKNSVIRLRDTDDKSFEEFLRFLYTDQCTLTPEIAVSVMYLAKKYMVPSLTEKCVAVLRSSIKPENVVTVLEQAIQFDEKELEEKCWEVAEKQTSKAVTSAAFDDISQATLSGLLKRKPLNIEEVELFQAVLKWSDRQCLKNSLEATGENKRSVIGDAIYEIRFLSMTQTEFAQNVHSSGLLTTEEIVQIYGMFSGLDLPSLKWKMSRRRQQTVVRFARCSVSDIQPHQNGILCWNYAGNKSDCLSFSVNKPVTFRGVRLFGGNYGSKYEVTLEVSGAKVSGTYTSELNNEGVSGFDVMLSKPILISQNKVITMAATINGPSSDRVTKGRPSVKVNEVTVTFSEASGSTNGTGVSGGQFYEIILSI